MSLLYATLEFFPCLSYVLTLFLAETFDMETLKGEKAFVKYLVES